MTPGSELLWANFLQHPESVQAELLQGLIESLPDMTIREQAAYFKDAPAEVILKCLPKLAWQAQKTVYMEHLPVKAHREAARVMDYEALIALKIRRRNRCMA